MKKYPDKNTLINSARGTESHTPFTPINVGSTRIFITIKTNVRTKEIIAEVFPSENAVNIEEEKILIPAKTKFKENRKNPVLASAYVSVPTGVKISTMTGDITRANTVTIMEEIAINPTQILKILFNSL